MHQRRPFLPRKGDGGFNWRTLLARKGDKGFNPTQVDTSTGATGFRPPAQPAYRAWLRCRWVAAWPDRALRQHTEPHSSNQVPLVWRAPEGPEGPGCGARGWRRGLAGLRADAPSQGLAARTARGRNAAHGHTKQPGPSEQDARRPEHPWGRKQPGPAGRTNHNLRNWAASRPTARSARNAILKSPGHPQCRRRSAPRAHQEKPR